MEVTTQDSQTLVDDEATANTVYGLSPEDWSHAALSVVVVGASGVALCLGFSSVHAHQGLQGRVGTGVAGLLFKCKQCAQPPARE